jgi:hypothetical protein
VAHVLVDVLRREGVEAAAVGVVDAAGEQGGRVGVGRLPAQGSCQLPALRKWRAPAPMCCSPMARAKRVSRPTALAAWAASSQSKKASLPSRASQLSRLSPMMSRS